MKVSTIAVATDPKLRDLYQQQAEALGVDCDVASSLHELFETLKETAYNGLLIDLATLVKANPLEKSQCHELLRLFPTLRLRWDEANQQLLCLLYGSRTSEGMSLQVFIDDYCRPFTARRIRKHKRMKLHYNVLLSRDENFSEGAVERSTTLNISLGGCALITGQDWEAEEKVWLRFLEFEDQSTICARVCRWTPWGTEMRIPCIGVCFEDLRKAQQEQISHPGKAIYEKNNPPG